MTACLPWQMPIFCANIDKGSKLEKDEGVEKIDHIVSYFLPTYVI